MTGYSITLLLDYLKDFLEEVDLDLAIKHLTTAKFYVSAIVVKTGYSFNF